MITENLLQVTSTQTKTEAAWPFSRLHTSYALVLLPSFTVKRNNAIWN